MDCVGDVGGEGEAERECEAGLFVVVSEQWLDLDRVVIN